MDWMTGIKTTLITFLKTINQKKDYQSRKSTYKNIFTDQPNPRSWIDLVLFGKNKSLDVYQTCLAI